ncbi:hypothetical protein D9758_016736 [Tetrapyrgos nigripes]|uniref:Uncharacterized protein n=1 Tax=Tetrapyrgos nigripes TaxID=182062 RepID=A0A8H5FHD5_9AGAR|nr:hypothetical protein D9758_016736 [Tetrapyrgos nigripes]
MKYILFASSLVVLTNLLGSVVADQLTFYQVVDPSDPGDVFPTDAPAAIPIGAADGATTYRIEDIITDPVTDTNGAVSTQTVTYTATIVASSAGWKVEQPAEDGEGGGEIECHTPDAQGNGECIVRANLDGTTFATTQTGSMVSLVVSVSGTAGNGGSGNNKKAARGLIGGMIGAVVGGVVFGGLLLI